MPSAAGWTALAASSMGYPLTQGAIRLGGRRGAAVVEAVCVGLLVRDLALLATGTSRVLRAVPAALLWGETAAAGAAVATGLRPVVDEDAARAAAGWPPVGVENVRRLAVAALFGLHTVRFWIYLQPDQGRRPD